MAMPLPEPADSPDAVFHIHGVTKVYRMGDVEVHALRGVDLDLYGGEFVVVLGVRRRPLCRGSCHQIRPRGRLTKRTSIRVRSAGVCRVRAAHRWPQELRQPECPRQSRPNSQ
jgi:hypothetical protein